MLICVTVLEDRRSTIDIAKVREALHQRREVASLFFGAAGVPKHANLRHLAKPLRVSQCWHCRRNAREQHYKLPAPHILLLALQLPFMQVSESMGNHDSKIVDAA